MTAPGKRPPWKGPPPGPLWRCLGWDGAHWHWRPPPPEVPASARSAARGAEAAGSWVDSSSSGWIWWWPEPGGRWSSSGAAAAAAAINSGRASSRVRPPPGGGLPPPPGPRWGCLGWDGAAWHWEPPPPRATAARSAARATWAVGSWRDRGSPARSRSRPAPGGRGGVSSEKSDPRVPPWRPEGQSSQPTPGPGGAPGQTGWRPGGQSLQPPPGPGLDARTAEPSPSSEAAGVQDPAPLDVTPAPSTFPAPVSPPSSPPPSSATDMPTATEVGSPSRSPTGTSETEAPVPQMRPSRPPPREEQLGETLTDLTSGPPFATWEDSLGEIWPRRRRQAASSRLPEPPRPTGEAAYGGGRRRRERQWLQQEVSDPVAVRWRSTATCNAAGGPARAGQPRAGCLSSPRPAIQARAVGGQPSHGRGFELFSVQPLQPGGDRVNSDPPPGTLPPPCRRRRGRAALLEARRQAPY